MASCNKIRWYEWQVKSAKVCTSICVWIAQALTESRESRLNVHTNQILAISLCLEQSTHLYVYFLLILFAIPTNITFWKCFCIFLIYFLVVTLATTCLL